MNTSTRAVPGYPFGTRYLLGISILGLGKIINPSEFNFFLSIKLNRIVE